MDEKFLPRHEHDEFVKRMEEEHRRINHRMGEVESGQKENNKLLVAIEKLALNMEIMQKEQKEQGERLEALESRDGEMWRKVSTHAITAIIGAVICFIFTQIGM